jgi:hypothetical protein
MNNFENNSRRKQEIKGRPLADLIYHKNWDYNSEGILIKRYEFDDKLILDKEFAIDVTLTLPNGMLLNGQEKYLSFKYSSFGTLTVEYMQNPQTKEKGDWFKLAPQFYFCGYFNESETDFIKYVLVDWPKLVLNSNDGLIVWYDNKNQDGNARASFRYTYFKNIPDDCIIDIKL